MATMSRLPLLVLSVPIVPALASCAHLDMSRTGFLDDYTSLEPSAEHRVWGVPDAVDLWVAPDLAGKYDAVIVEPVVYRQQEGAKHEPTAEEIERLTAAYTEKLGRILGERLEVVSTPGPRTARVRASISEVHPVSVLLNVIGLILVVPPDMGGVVGELEVLDAATGARRLAMTSVREGTPFLVLECFTRYGHARHGMKKWAELVRDELKP